MSQYKYKIRNIDFDLIIMNDVFIIALRPIFVNNT